MGVSIEAVRVGEARGPNRVDAVESARFVATSSRIGIPLATRTTIGNEHLLVARVDAVDLGSRWCGIDLSPGMVVVYSPGAEHTATNRPGLKFTFAMTTVDQMNGLADSLRTVVHLPSRGRVRVMDRTATAPIDRAFSRLAAALRTDDALPNPVASDVLPSLVALLRGPPYRVIGDGNGIDSRKIVAECLHFAESVQRIPSIGELCLAGHVSERRLRQAFTDQFDMPPTRFFRTWALGVARRRLQSGDADATTVSRIAADIGFHHLGRFSAYYRTLYEETPSATLRATAPSARAK